MPEGTAAQIQCCRIVQVWNEEKKAGRIMLTFVVWCVGLYFIGIGLCMVFVTILHIAESRARKPRKPRRKLPEWLFYRPARRP